MWKKNEEGSSNTYSTPMPVNQDERIYIINVYIYIYEQIDRQIDRQIDKYIDRYVYAYIYINIYIFIYIYIYIYIFIYFYQLHIIFTPVHHHNGFMANDALGHIHVCTWVGVEVINYHNSTIR